MKNSYLAIIAVLLASMMMVTACGAKSTQAEPSSTEQVEQKVQEEETNKTLTEEPSLDKENNELVGIWVSESNPSKTIDIHADGSCIIENTVFYWIIEEDNSLFYFLSEPHKADEEYNDFARHILAIVEKPSNSESKSFQIVITMGDFLKESNLALEDSIFVKGEGEFSNSILGTPVNIEITLDNWQDYFEIIEYTDCTYNDSEELTSAQLHYYIVLKEEFQDNLDLKGENSVAFEIEYSSAWYYCQYDEKEQKILPVEIIEDGTLIPHTSIDNNTSRTGFTQLNSNDERSIITGTATVEDGFLSDSKTLLYDFTTAFEEMGKSLSYGNFDTDVFIVRILDVFEMLSIEGTIFLYE